MAASPAESYRTGAKTPAWRAGCKSTFEKRTNLNFEKFGNLNLVKLGNLNLLKLGNVNFVRRGELLIRKVSEDDQVLMW